MGVGAGLADWETRTLRLSSPPTGTSAAGPQVQVRSVYLSGHRRIRIAGGLGQRILYATGRLTIFSRLFTNASASERISSASEAWTAKSYA